jgi:hypothetical protein
MKKPALLLSLFMVLLTLPAQAEMIVNDHFDGSDIDSSWNITMSSNTTGWDYQMQDSQLKVNQIGINSTSTRGEIYLSQQFNPIDDFEAEISLSWEMPNASTAQILGIGLFDSDHNRISGIYFDDSWYSQSGVITANFGGTTHAHYGGLPLNGSATASIIRKDGVLSYFWDGSLLTSKSILDYAASLEILFVRYPQSNGGKMNIDYVTLEGDPVDLSATPEPGTMMLLGSALGLGAWWQRRRKRRA